MFITSIEEEIDCVITELHHIYHVINLQCNPLEKLYPEVGIMMSFANQDFIVGFQVYHDR